MSKVKHSVLKGALFIVVAELFIAINAVLVKRVMGDSHLPLEITVFYRNLFGFLVLSLFVGRRGLRSIKTKVLHLHITRAIVGVITMYCFFYGLHKLPLAQGMTLFMTTPFFMPLIALIWLKEPVKPLTYGCIFVGFIGVVLIMNPSTEISFAILIALLGGFLAAVTKVNIRKLSETDHLVTIVFYFALLSMIFSFIPALNNWVVPTFNEFLLLVGIGFAASLGQILLTRGLSYAPAAIIGPIGFISIIYSTAIGWFFWGEGLNPYFVMGAILIILAGAALVYFSEKPSTVEPDI